MSGGPQVFLGATTFLSDCPVVRALCWGRAAWCARGRRPAREPSALRASLGASSRSPARPRRRPRAPQTGSAVLAAASHRAALGMLRPGPAAAHVHRSQAPRSCDDGLLNNVARNSLACLSHVEVASLELQRFERGSNTDRWKLCATFVLADVVASSHRQRDPAQQ